MNRREMIKSAAVGTGAVIATRVLPAAGIVSLALLETACGKNISGWITSIVSGFAEIKSLLPDLGFGQSVIDKIGSLIAKGVRIAQDFDDAYKAGKFSSAIVLFKNLGGLIDQVRSELGVSADNKILKAAFAIIGIARVAIAILLERQGQNQPAIMAAVLRASPDEAAALAEIKRLAAVNLPIIR